MPKYSPSDPFLQGPRAVTVNGATPTNGLALVEALNQTRSGASVGSSPTGQPLFASREDAILVLGGRVRDRTDRVFLPSVLTYPGPAIVITTNTTVRDKTAAFRRSLGPVYQVDLSGDTKSPIPVRSWSFEQSPFRTRANTYRVGYFLAETSPDIIARYAHVRTWPHFTKQFVSAMVYSANVLGYDFERVGQDLRHENLDAYRNVLQNMGTTDCVGPSLRRFDHPLDVAFRGALDGAGSPWRSEILACSADLLDRARSLATPEAPALTSETLREVLANRGTLYVTTDPAQPNTIDLQALVGEINALKYVDTTPWESNWTSTLLLIDQPERVCPKPQLDAIVRAGYKDEIQVMLGLQDASAVQQIWERTAGYNELLSLSHHRIWLGGYNDMALAKQDLPWRSESFATEVQAADLLRPDRDEAYHAHQRGREFVRTVSATRDPFWRTVFAGVEREFGTLDTGGNGLS